MVMTKYKKNQLLFG